MKQLSIKQRLDAYEWAIKQFEIGAGQHSLCLTLYNYLVDKISIYVLFPDDVTAAFPEFVLFKPEEIVWRHENWFSTDELGDTWRVIVLNECITECKKLLNQKRKIK